MAETNDLDELKLREAQLERELSAVREHRVALERGRKPRPSEGVRPLRAVVLDLLLEAECPLNSLLLASVIRPLYGRTIASTRFGTLAKDEASSFDSSRPRPVYLCHCLTHDQGQAVKRFWARSDWPLADRIMGPTTGRILFLRGAAWTIRLARSAELGERLADNVEILKYIAADQARDAGLPVKRGEFPYDAWLTAIDAALERHADEDRAARKAAAVKLQQGLSERELLFGTNPGFVSLPGSRVGWRSTAQ